MHGLAACLQLHSQPGPDGDERRSVPSQAPAFDERDRQVRNHLRPIAGAERVGLIRQHDEVGLEGYQVLECDARVAPGIIRVDVGQA